MTTTCIPDDVLESLQLGVLGEDEAATWEAHLLSCPACLERTRSLQAADTLVEALRSARGLPAAAPPPPSLLSLITRLKNRSELETIAGRTQVEQPVEATLIGETEAPARPGPSAPKIATELLSTGTILGPYRILDKLGEGGMGAVYKAQHVKLDKTVALKVLSAQVTRQADAVQRFEREMRAVGKLEHPHIVRAMDAGEINGIHYLAMEYVDGVDLHKLVKDRGALTITNACKAVRQSAQALAAAHGAGLIHRDIKPSNLLVGKNGQIKVLDLGLALLAEDKSTTEGITTAGQTFGTPDYMAPEQWEDAHAADPRTDLYALGCTLYYLLVGRPPYGTDQYRTAVGKMKGHVTQPIPELTTARHDVPEEVAAIYRKLMAKDPADRFQKASELVEALAPFVSSKAPAAKSLDATAPQDTQPYPAQPPSATPPQTTAASAGPRRPTRRLTLAAAGAAALLLCGVIIITITNRDGTQTKITVPEGTSVDIDPAAGSQVKITQGEKPASVEKLPVTILESVLGMESSLDLVPSFDVKRGVAPWRTTEALNRWSREGSTLTFDADGKPGLIRFPVPELRDANYRLIIEFTRKAGTHGFNIDLPLSSGMFTINLDEGDRHRTGLAKTGKYTDDFQIETNRRYRLEITLDGHAGRDRAELRIDNQELLAWQGNRQAIAIPQRNANAPESQWPGLWIPARNSSWVFHRLEITLPGTGWHGWPTNAPKPAIAPFDAAQAKKHQDEWAAYLKVPVEYTNSIGMKFRLIPPGEFMMGSTPEEIAAALKDIDPNDKLWQKSIQSEAPQHRVILTQPIYLAMKEVSQAQYEKVLGSNPSHFTPMGTGKDTVSKLDTTEHPVEQVSWHEAVEFCANLSKQENLQPLYFREGETITSLGGTGYRLPSEAEWEFACGAGKATKYWIGDQLEDLIKTGWFGGNSGGRTHATGELNANPFGLSDIYGNVWEWVLDGWDATYYGQFVENPAINPNGPFPIGSLRVLRGGGWNNTASSCRSSGRVATVPTSRNNRFGFRVALSVDAVRQALPTSTAKNTSPIPAEVAVPDEKNLAIRLMPGAHVEVPSLTLDPAAPYTLEAWVTPLDASLKDKHVVGWTGPCSLYVSRAELNWSFGLARNNGPFQYLLAPSSAVVDRRIHLAAVRTGREFRLFVDGQRVGNTQEHPGPLMNQRAPFSLSSPRQPFPGDYDEVRVSRVARYDENFTPQLRLEPDADTLALYHCDENGGEQLVDASSHKHHGKIVGPAKWIGRGQAAASADAPKPAIAPFDAAAAKAHQEAWAKHLGVPVEYTNSIGMKFRLIPPGEFLMGSTPEEVESTLKAVAPNDLLYLEAVKTETPRHKVVLTKALYLGVHEVTQKQYQAIMGTNPSAFGGADIDNRRVKDAATIAVLSEGTDTANYPVDSLSWNDAAEFCTKLSQREKFKPTYFRAGNTVTVLEGNGYRLPTEAEWEFACRAGTSTRYWSGDNDTDLRSIAWYGPNAGKQSHAVGELKPNPFGLHDMHGNLWEWVQDWWEPGYYDQFTEKPATDPLGASISTVKKRVVRGGYWRGNSATCRASYRNAYVASTRDHVLGFRVTLDVESVRGSLAMDKKSPAPPRAMAPFDAAAARAHQEAWAKHLGVPVETTNSIGAKLVLIPPGEFLMGAPEKDADATPQEKPQHRVTLTKPFAIGATEVTNRQFRQFVEATKYVTQAESDGQGAFEINPKVRRSTNTWDSPDVKKKSGDDHPVRCVSWEDARRFCEWLSKTEGDTYRLPTEAEWEFACRAGTTTRFSFGDNPSDSPSPPGASGAPLRAVAQLPANPFGLFDMHGSVNEFCLDSGRTYTTDAVTDPLGSLEIELPAVVRGGAISSNAARQRSSNRFLNDARRFPETNFATVVLGFRVVREFSTAPPIAKAPFDAAQAKAHQAAWAAHLKLPVESTNSVGMKLRLIPPGEFLMGSTDEQVAVAHQRATEAKAMPTVLERIQRAERPQHRVVISRPFQCSATEVTNADFRKFVEATQYVTDAEKFGFGDDGEKQLTEKVTDEQKKLTWRTPGYPIADDLPVTQVSWNDAQAYCRWLSTQEQAVYRLPTEAEWEYACRAGTTTHYSFGDDEPTLEQFAWFGGNTQRKPEAAGAKPANGFGLHDMHGNLFEWCQDIFDEGWYQRSSSIDPVGPATGPASGTYYVVRGGFWGGSAPLCRSAFRINHSAAYRHRSGGFRVVKELAARPPLALKFGGGTRVEIPGVKHESDQPLTIEAVVLVSEASPNAMIAGFAGQIALRLRDRKFSFRSIQTDGAIVETVSDQDAVLGKATHLAGVYSDGKLRLFVDGQPQGDSLPCGPAIVADVIASIGANPKGDDPLTGEFTAVRLSKAALYESAFTPPGQLDRRDDTLVLFDFSRAEAGRLEDLSGHARHGQTTIVSQPGP